MAKRVTATLSTPTLVFPTDQISKVEVLEEHGKHQMALVDVRYAVTPVGHPAISGLAEKTPVNLVFGSVGQNLRRMFGYVHHAEDLPTEDNEAGTHIVRYVIVGTSLPMNTQHRRTWTMTSRTAVVREIVNSYNLRLVIESNNEVMPSIVQSGESDFQFLNRLADELGYTFWVDGSTVWFINKLTQPLGPSASELLTFSLDKTLGSRDTLRSLTTVRGRAVPGQGRPVNQTINGYDSRGGRIFTVKNKSLDNDPDVYVPSVVTSIAQARARLDAEAARNSHFSMTKASVFGQVKVRPGRCIVLTGRAVTADTQGTWVVQSVTHEIKPSTNEYYSSFEATKGDVLFTRTVHLSGFDENLECVLDNEIWRSITIGTFNVNPPKPKPFQDPYDPGGAT